MPFPKAGNTYAQERRGISAVASYAADRAQIWRETGTGDVGIDGNLEYVTHEGFATGRIVAVQVKAGPSYFNQRTQRGWKFYVEKKHQHYWESFAVPVVLVLHDTQSGESYWTDVRQSLRTPAREEAFVEVPEANKLSETDATSLFENAGVLNQPFIEDLNAVLAKLLNTRSREASFPLSYFDLFTQGLCNLCRSIYYHMDLVCTAVEFNLEAADSPWGMGMGSEEHEFTFGFVKFLVAQSLAQVDYADCLIDWVDREMQPRFVAPLTSRGRALVRLIQQEEKSMVAQGKLPDEGHVRVAQAGIFHMEPASYVMRLPRIRSFQAAHLTDRQTGLPHDFG
ncbi:MAG: DUF4365 domain-containing protein [Achromobacter sp.]|uniref:DUF4365 domain-containing protein n=1 Tax=Achromobacter sp. TaxID=134375 RepID=UPI0012BEC065|nr:DUF4365 domain-containing protein [Achromobacter sp.]MPS81770.1 DUF4365 domain-containing protein [Achromobacter sp.]